MLQRYGIYAAKTALEKDINVFLAEKYQDVKLSLRPIVSLDAIEKMFAGQLKEIHFIAHEIPEDIADKIKLDVVENQGTLKMVFTARRNTQWYIRVVP